VHWVTVAPLPFNLKPGTGVPTGPAFSKARRLPSEHVMKCLFELDAARGDAELGIGSLWKGLERTALDGTTMELFRSDVLADAFGVPGDGARHPQPRRPRVLLHGTVDPVPRRRRAPGLARQERRGSRQHG